MITIEVVIRDGAGSGITVRKEYELDLGQGSLHDIEGLVEQFKNAALTDIESELLKAKQKEFIESKKKDLICNGTMPVKIKTLHGQFEFPLQRFIDKTDGGKRGLTYFDVTQQLREGYISTRLHEWITYYSNRLSYTEVARLVGRMTGTRLLSSQTIQKKAVDQAVKVSAGLEEELQEIVGDPSSRFPQINPKVAIYDPEKPEVLILADAIQVKGQKAERHRNQGVEDNPSVQDEAGKSPRISSTVILLETRTGEFDYSTGLIADDGSERLPITEVVKSKVIQEYGGATEPLNVVAITDGARNLRLQLLAIFGVMITVILDWYHLSKKVRDLMSGIAWNKKEKQKHLKFLLAH